jgi:hypothetical protein
MAIKVERVDPRGDEFQGQQLTTQLEAKRPKGWKLTSVVPLYDVILLVWDVPDVERRSKKS